MLIKFNIIYLLIILCKNELNIYGQNAWFLNNNIT